MSVAMKQSAFSNAIGKYFKSTTLHGFKYLLSHYYCDRIGWALCCLASACCAGVLCVVLWERFLKVPALLQLQDLTTDSEFQQIPSVVVCQPPDVVFENFLSRITFHGENTTRLPATLANALQGKPTDEAQVDLLERLLHAKNMSLQEVLQAYTPDCIDLIKRCRWRSKTVECEQLFKKESTRWGVCCVASPARFEETSIPPMLKLNMNRQLDMALQCSNGSARGCEFHIKYVDEEWEIPTRLTPGLNYWAYITFTSEKDSDSEKLVDGTCISAGGYSESQCLFKCAASKCGCSYPLRSIGINNEDILLKPCPLKRISCLRTIGLKGNSSCLCLPSCQKVITRIDYEYSQFDGNIQSCLDPIYAGLNTTEVVIFRLRVNINVSKIFSVMPTETWLTLLSSLGGVFNMFLGVGLFSALEFVFLLFVKLPVAVRRSEMDSSTVINWNRVDGYK